MASSSSSSLRFSAASSLSVAARCFLRFSYSSSFSLGEEDDDAGMCMDEAILYTARASTTRGPEPKMAGKWGAGTGGLAEALCEVVREGADVFSRCAVGVVCVRAVGVVSVGVVLV